MGWQGPGEGYLDRKQGGVEREASASVVFERRPKIEKGIVKKNRLSQKPKNNVRCTDRGV